MGFTITTIKNFNENNLIKIGKVGFFLVNYFKEKNKDCNQTNNITNKGLKNLDNLIDIKDPFIGNIEFFAYKNQKGNIYFEYISGQEIYNGNEEVNYISLLPFNNPELQQKIKIISGDIEKNNCNIKSIKEGLLNIKKFLTKELVIEYTNNTIIGSTDITGYEGQGKGQKAKYIKEKDIFYMLKEFSKRLSDKENINSKIIYVYLKSLVLNNFAGIGKQEDNKIEQQVINIINNNNLLKNEIKKNLYLIEYEELEQIDNIESLIKLIINDSEYISGLICHKCSAINYNFDIDKNYIKFVCKSCGKDLKSNISIGKAKKLEFE